MKIQSWLTLFEMTKPGAGTYTSIDGDFGPATEKAVMNFQKSIGVTQTGIADEKLFSRLCSPLQRAFEAKIEGKGLRQLIVNVAKNHLLNKPFELTIEEESNSGPWVRSYMDNHEGEPWYWCMGFVQTIIDQACSIQGKKFTDLMPLTYSCDTIATTGLHKKILFRFAAIRNNPALLKPGDIFLLQKTSFDWFHTGIIISIGDDVFETIEGNTNAQGSHNGNAVYKKIRNFRQAKIDVLSIEQLV